MSYRVNLKVVVIAICHEYGGSDTDIIVKELSLTLGSKLSESRGVPYPVNYVGINHMINRLLGDEAIRNTRPKKFTSNQDVHIWTTYLLISKAPPGIANLKTVEEKVFFDF